MFGSIFLHSHRIVQLNFYVENSNREIEIIVGVKKFHMSWVIGQLKILIMTNDAMVDVDSTKIRANNKYNRNKDL